MNKTLDLSLEEIEFVQLGLCNLILNDKKKDVEDREEIDKLKNLIRKFEKIKEIK